MDASQHSDSAVTQNAENEQEELALLTRALKNGYPGILDALMQERNNPITPEIKSGAMPKISNDRRKAIILPPVQSQQTVTFVAPHSPTRTETAVETQSAAETVTAVHPKAKMF